MTNNNNCESYPNCNNCPNSFNCWITGKINAPNPALNIDVVRYNNLNQYKPIDCPTNDLTINISVLHLIRWELDFRKRHNKAIAKIREHYNIGNYKQIDLTNIINWYNNKYCSNISKDDLLGFLHQINYNIEELKQWQNIRQH